MDELAPHFEELYAQLSNRNERVSLSYRSQLSSDDLSILLQRNLRNDLLTAKTNYGIHKDDLDILINEKPIKKHGSQGQLKSAIISLKLAQMRWIESMTSIVPIILLDDIFDKLDGQRVKQLLTIVCQDERQVFISDTDNKRLLSIFKELDMSYNHYIISEGAIADG